MNLSHRRIDKSNWNYVRKFVQGRPVISVQDILTSISSSDKQWFIIKGHRVPPGFILQMRLQTLIDLVSRGELFYAIPVKEENPAVCAEESISESDLSYLRGYEGDV